MQNLLVLRGKAGEESEGGPVDTQQPSQMGGYDVPPTHPPRELLSAGASGQRQIATGASLPIPTSRSSPQH